MNKNIWGLIILLIGVGLPLKAQEIRFELPGSALELFESSFELEEVVDSRPTRSSLGSIFSSSNQSALTHIQDGLERGIKRFYNNSINQTGSQRRIQMRVLNMEIAEKKQSGSVVSGDVKMKFGYYLLGAFEPVHLVDYEAGMNYRRSIHRTDLVEQVLSQGLRKSIQFLNEWIMDQAASNRNLARSVRLEIIKIERKSDRDTVFYHPERPIRWEDFRERPNVSSKFNAAIFTSLALEGSPYMQDGTVVLPLEVKLYMLPGSSWIKRDPSDYGLNHEQRHFDVTRIVGNRLESRLQSMELNPDNYDGLVNSAFLDAFREMNRIQEIYDRQTRHGMDSMAQSRWNTILDQALKGDMAQLEAELMKGR